MPVAQKFLFDLSFDPPAAEPAPAPVEEAPPLPPAITPEELAAARADGFAEGHRAAVADADAVAAAREAAATATLSLIEERLGALVAGLGEARRDAERAAAELALAVARKIVPALARRGAVDEVMALAAQSLREAIDEPRIVIRVPDELFEPIRRRLDRLKAVSGFEGKVVVLAEEAMQGADCRIEWAEGGAERNEARLWREIEAAIERNLPPLAAPQPAAPQPAASQPAEHADPTHTGEE
jgi:flagellar assembly protein FliH